METETGRAPGIEIACPSCRKVAVATLPPPGDFACQRCRCSLATLAEISLAATALVGEARAALLRGDHAAALDHAAAAWDLRHSRAAASIAFIAATLDGDPLEGVAWLRASHAPSAS